MNICGICKRPPRAGEDHARMRLTAEDMKDKQYPEPKTPGLYQCCQDCLKAYLPVVAARLGFTPESMPHGHQV
jgi:hypothetical protein